MYSSIPPLDFVTVWSIQTKSDEILKVCAQGRVIVLAYHMQKKTNQALVSYSLHLTNI